MDIFHPQISGRTKAIPFQCDVVNNAYGYHYITLGCNSLSNIDKN